MLVGTRGFCGMRLYLNLTNMSTESGKGCTCSKPRNLMMLSVTDGWKRSPPAGLPSSQSMRPKFENATSVCFIYAE